MKKLLVGAAIVVAFHFANGQDKPKADHKPLKDANRYKLVAAFQKSQNLQMQVQTRAMDLCKAEPNCKGIWDRYQLSVGETNVAADAVAKDESLPPGTQFSVDTDKAEVSYVLPEAPKPAEKK